MKKLLLISFIFISGFVQAQISETVKVEPSVTVGRIAPMGAFIAELNYRISGDTTYTLMFNDMAYTKIDVLKSVSFTGSADKLYEIFKSVFSDENKKNKDYTLAFTLGKESVSVSNHKRMGVTEAMFLMNNAYFFLNEKQVNKLFGH